MNTPYRNLLRSESHGYFGGLGIEINVSCKLSSLDHDKLNDAAYKALKLVEEEVIAALLAADPKNAEIAAKERADLIGLFPSPVFVEEVVNGYDSGAYSRHLPWFIVTTTVGRFRLGWRKRVIHIEWEGIDKAPTAEVLFPHEDVTKDGRLIHAWSLDKAREYVAAVIASIKS